MAPGELEQRPPNPARAVQSFVGEVVSFVVKPPDMLNHGVAEWTRGVAKPLGSYPAARLYQDYVLGLPHGHSHPPFIIPFQSTGIVMLAGARNVLINGSPAARNGDVGFAAWRRGYIPIFEVLTGSSIVFIGGARAIQNSLEVAKLMLQAKLKDAGRRTIFSGATTLRS